MYLVLEYMKKGDLVNVLKGRESSTPGNGGNKNMGGHTVLSDLELWNIFRQIVAGVRYLHYQNVVHGDIKPQNLLVGENGIVKIADFGISKMLSNSDEQLGNAAGTPAFMSPELCAAEAFSGQVRFLDFFVSVHFFSFNFLCSFLPSFLVFLLFFLLLFLNVPSPHYFFFNLSKNVKKHYTLLLSVVYFSASVTLSLPFLLLSLQIFGP